MKRNIVFFLALLFLMLGTVSALHAGYKTDPWGSKIWIESERPPHRSLSDRKARQVRDYGSNEGYWNDKHNRWHYQKYRQFGNGYDQKPTNETVIKREKRIPVYKQVHQEPTKLQCAGETISRNDPRTGEKIIEYVTGARDC